MKRTIFVGSSHEGRDDAKWVIELLKAATKHDAKLELEPKLWDTFFEPGSLTFQALEDMLTECCAAVFVIRGDDVVYRHEASDDPHSPTKSPPFSANTPRGNVLLEFGLVAGRLGRHNVALCRFDKAELPSDLAGMTVIEMTTNPIGVTPSTNVIVSSPPLSARVYVPDKEIVTSLSRWGTHLLATAKGIPRVGVFHGYTGRWDFELQLHRCAPYR
jgi:predicted nucleotide-binding protein